MINGSAQRWVGRIGSAAGITVVTLIVAQFSGCEIAEGMPDTALVYADDSRRLYASPTCVANDDRAQDFSGDPRLTTAGDVRSRRYRGERACSSGNGFGGNAWSIPHYVAIKAGLLSQRSRWAKDGTWNW